LGFDDTKISDPPDGIERLGSNCKMNSEVVAMKMTTFVLMSYYAMSSADVVVPTD
jgi:hypothetical protein